MNPDTVGPKTYGSYGAGSGSGSATLHRTQRNESDNAFSKERAKRNCRPVASHTPGGVSQSP